MKRVLFSLFLCAGLSGAACNSSGPPPDKDEITTALGKADVLILDVRSVGEFNDGHVDGAINIPVGEIERIKTVSPDTDRQIVVHCKSGGRSANATRELKSMGYTNILDAKTPDAVSKALGKPLVK